MKSTNYTVITSIVLSLSLAMTTLLSVLPQSVVFNRIEEQDTCGIYEDNRHCERLPIRLQEVSMTVQENRQFSLIDDKAWAATLPGQRGFVRLGPKGRSFSLALYHQLHCVNAIRFSYTVARDGLITDPKVLKSKVGHDNHCFQFIRQNILCRADSTPITLSRYNQTLSGAGFGARHRCKNWAQVRQFVIENDEKWAGKPDLMEGDILMLDNE